MIDGIKVLDTPRAWSYTPIPGTTYNILKSEIRLLEDQLQPGEYPVYADSTGVEPQEEKDGLVQSFNETTQKWEYVEDHRGETGFIDGKPYVIEQFGPWPTGFTKELPLSKKIENHTNELKYQIKLMLKNTDYLMMPDYPLGEEDKKKIMEFRYQLRNLDKQEGFPWYGEESKLPEWPLEGIKTKPY